MRIILVRHGETEENAAGVIQGHLPGRLSARGREQVQKLGQRLATEHIDAAYSSDLARARQTAEAIARHHPDLRVTWTDELRERFLGRYQGMKGSDVDRVELAASPEVESYEQMIARAARLLDRLRKAHANQTVLLCGHGGINHAILAAVTGRSIPEIKAASGLDNAGICLLEGGNGSLAVTAVNDISHLGAQGST